jgi:hypothetical protein
MTSRNSTPHQLEAFLQAQKAEGQMSSEGGFTLDRDKALQKIAEFQSPYPESWALNLAQASVLLGGTDLTISQGSKETEFLSVLGGWEYQDFDFEKEFFNPSTLPVNGLQVLRTALWSAGVGQKKPFQLSLPDEDKSYIWDGEKLIVMGGTKPSNHLRITVSHRSLIDGKGFPILRSVQAATYNNTLKEHLAGCLYTLPIATYLDSLRLECYGNSPTHGFKRHSYPVRVFGFETGRPALPTSSSCIVSSEQNPKLVPLCQAINLIEFYQKPWSIIVLLSAHGGLYGSGDSTNWRTEPTHSVVCWVRHGVVVQKEQVDLPKLSVSVSIHLSADGLPTDYSGFSINEDAAAPIRKEALRLVAGYLRDEEVDFEVADRTWFNTKKVLSGVAVAGGTGLVFLTGPVGFFVVFAGLFGGISLAQGVEALCTQFGKDYAKLQKAFPERFRPTEGLEVH